jgi:hypothetical protein
MNPNAPVKNNSSSKMIFPEPSHSPKRTAFLWSIVALVIVAVAAIAVVAFHLYKNDQLGLIHPALDPQVQAQRNLFSEMAAAQGSVPALDATTSKTLFIKMAALTKNNASKKTGSDVKSLFDQIMAEHKSDAPASH